MTMFAEEPKVYDSKAILQRKWVEQEDKLKAENWEFLKMDNGVVYLRRPWQEEYRNDSNG